MGLGMALLAGAVGALPLVTTTAGVMGYGIAMGVAGGVVTVVFFSVWSAVFGRVELGRIQGAAQMMTVVASAVGPVLLAGTLERTGSYDLMFRVLAGLTAALGLACWRVRMPV
jgi:MFS family permease